jgi:hypothetical protein
VLHSDTNFAICSETQRDPQSIYPATSDQVRRPDSTVGHGRGDDPSSQPAVDGSIEQAQPPAARAEHHILEAEA